MVNLIRRGRGTMCVISETHHLLRVSEYKLQLAFSPVFTLHLHPFTRQFRSRQKVPGSSEISKAITLDKHNSCWRESLHIPQQQLCNLSVYSCLQEIRIHLQEGKPIMYKEKEAYNVFIHNHLYRKENGDMYVRLIFYGKGLCIASVLIFKSPRQTTRHAYVHIQVLRQRHLLCLCSHL